MRRILQDLFLLTSSILFFTNCEKDNTIPKSELIPRKDILLTRAEQKFINDNNIFALELFKTVSQKEGHKSIVISPLAITIDLGMINNGAVGDTREEINKSIGFGNGTVEDFNMFCKSMLAQSSTVDPSITFETANAALVNSLFFPLKSDFIKAIEDNFSAEVINKDFAKEDIKGLINRWCDKKTKGMIKELIHEPVSSDEYAHFLTGTYFKGIWSNQFKKRDTEKGQFTCEDGNKLELIMMHQKSGFKMASIKGLCSVIVLPYGNGAYRMTILLPIEGKTISDIMRDLDSESWMTITNYLGRIGVEDVDLKLPVFETDFEVDLKETLIDMGINKAFTDADFSAMTDEKGVYLNKVQHKAHIKVDEQGSEVAAVVDVATMGGMSLIPFQPKVREFHANKPFIYAITEVSSGALFFLGQFVGY